MTAVVRPDAIAKLIPRLASDHDGEVVATARAIGRTLKSAGADLHDVADIVERSEARQHGSSHQGWRQTVKWCREHGSGRLRPNEQDFLENLMSWAGELTPKRGGWLRVIADRLRGCAETSTGRQR